MAKGLKAISKTTTTLWYNVNELYGEGVFHLAVNGLDEVELMKGYTEVVAKGQRNVQKYLRDLITNPDKSLIEK